MSQTYKYKALKPDGSTLKGALEAMSISDAKAKLRGMGLIVLHIDSSSTSAHSQSGKLSMSRHQLAQFSSQLAQLLEANIPLFESLEVLEDQMEGEKQQALISAIKEKIQKGGSFSKVIEEYPETFSSTYTAIVSSGEAVGGLSQAMRRIATLLEKDEAMKNRLVSALIYPILLTALLIIALLIMLLFVIPSIQGLFEGKELPIFTEIIFGLSKFVIDHSSGLTFTAAALIFLGFLEIKRPLVRKTLAQKALRWPIVGNYLIKSSIARFSRTLSTLLIGGAPLNTALEKAKAVVSNPEILRAIQIANEKLLQGELLSKAFQRDPFPKLFQRMVALGEETGNLEALIAQVADVYDEETSRLLDRATSLIQPLLLVGFGLIIGSTLLAILLPLSNFGALLSM